MEADMPIAGTRDERKAIIARIEAKRNSKVIAYVTSDRAGCMSQIAGDIVSIVHDHVRALGEDGQNKLDLVLYSRGGQSDVPWALVSMLREYCHRGSFSVLIPYRAHSAATVIALGADEIVMGRKAELGPIDATIVAGPYNPSEQTSPNRLPLSVEDVNGYFALLDRIGCARPDERMAGFRQLTDKVHPLALGAVNRQLEETKLVGLRLLNTRAKPFTEEENQEIIRKLSSEVYSHSHAISRTEALRYLGLKHVKRAEDCGLEDDLWNLYLSYRAYFDLENPFRPEECLVAEDALEREWRGLRYACVESLGRHDLCRKDLRVRRLLAVPPQVTVQLQNITFPPVTLSVGPDALPPEKQQALIQSTIQATIGATLTLAAEKAAAQLARSLPQRGFEHITLNSGWQTEA